MPRQTTGRQAARIDPEAQWAKASRLEKRAKWAEAVSGYSKMGNALVQHPLAADGLIKAALLAYRRMDDASTASRLLISLIRSYPLSPHIAQANALLLEIGRDKKG